MAKVTIRNPAAFEKKLQQFESLCKKEGIIREVQSRQGFTSKGEKARRRARISTGRWQSEHNRDNEE